MASLYPLSLSSKIYDDLSLLIKKSYPYSCILYIDEVINPELESRYNNRRITLENLRGPEKITQLQLFHGTKHKNINSIAQNGFCKELNKTSAYGIGTYFAKNAVYSRSYTDTDNREVSYMFICDVLIGNLTVLNSKREIDIHKYDNSVDSLTNPTIYVSPYDDGCIPRYLIAFHKNAK